MEIDNASSVLKIQQIENLLNNVLMEVREKSNDLMLNPDKLYIYVSDVYQNHLKDWLNNNQGLETFNPFLERHLKSDEQYQQFNNDLIKAIGDFVFDNSKNDHLSIKDFVYYLSGNLSNKNVFMVFKSLLKMVNEYQYFILNQVVLATFENKGYKEVIKAFEQLLGKNSYQGFVRYRYDDIKKETKVNYHKLLTQYITKEELPNLINDIMRSFNDNYQRSYVSSQEFFEKYVTELVKQHCIFLLNDVMHKVENNYGLQDTVSKFKQYLSKGSAKELLGSINEPPVSNGIWVSYLSPKNMKSLMISECGAKEFSFASNECLIEEYLHIIDKKHVSKRSK